MSSLPPTINVAIRMEVASSRPDHLPTLSATKTSELSLLVKSPFGSGAADVGIATPTFCFSVLAISKLYHTDSGIAMDCTDQNHVTQHLGD